MKSVTGRLILAAATALAVAGCDRVKIASMFQAGSPGEGEGEYSILLCVLRDAENHARDAAYYKRQTERETRWRGLFVVNKAAHSELYWGRYSAPGAARKNLKKAKTYRTQAGTAPYAWAIVLPLGVKDVGPPEWNLLNAKGAYTVVVAVFYDVPDARYFHRKQNAVAYCRQLREKGEHAYYHHGPARSKVTVGIFPDSIVKMVTSKGVVRPKVRDARVGAIIRRYKYLAVNGRTEKRTVVKAVGRRTGKIEKVLAKPELVRIPRRKESLRTHEIDRTGHSQRR